MPSQPIDTRGKQADPQPPASTPLNQLVRVLNALLALVPNTPAARAIRAPTAVSTS
jgi:hypothetical protein